MKTLRFLVAALPLLWVSCTESAPKEQQQVYVDTFFTQLYMPNSGGVTGADGTISILLDDGSSLFMTGDCFLGTVAGGKRDPGTPMINNTLIHISKDYKYLSSIYGGTPEDPKSLCTPLEVATSPYKFWYWPGHGFQKGNTLHLFMTKFYQGGEGQWGFRFGGTDYIRMNMTDYSVESVREIYPEACGIHWGHCVLQQDDYYYVYGTRSGAGYDPAQLCVSRAKFDEAKGELGVYEYFDGANWVADGAATAACVGIDVPVSEQFSVFKHNETYVLLTQRRAQQAGDIYTYIADSPAGPWRNKQQHYITVEQDNNKNLFTYNAMAHPQYINEANELLICYNVNSYDVAEVFRDVQTYRPVFLRVPMSHILE